MAIPKYWAKEIWVAAISHVTDLATGSIDTTNSWGTYMNSAQLREAFNETNDGLAAVGVKTTWTLVQLRTTDPIDKQIDLLAAKATPTSAVPVVQDAVTRYTHRHLL